VIRGKVKVTALGHFSSGGDNTTHIAYYPSTNTNVTVRKNSTSKNITKVISQDGLLVQLSRTPISDFYTEMCFQTFEGQSLILIRSPDINNKFCKKICIFFSTDISEEHNRRVRPANPESQGRHQRYSSKCLLP
jgi:hypothetical protein